MPLSITHQSGYLLHVPYMPRQNCDCMSSSVIHILNGAVIWTLESIFVGIQKTAFKRWYKVSREKTAFKKDLNWILHLVKWKDNHDFSLYTSCS